MNVQIYGLYSIGSIVLPLYWHNAENYHLKVHGSETLALVIAGICLRRLDCTG
jgi:hypothetical protein